MSDKIIKYNLIELFGCSDCRVSNTYGHPVIINGSTISIYVDNIPPMIDIVCSVDDWCNTLTLEFNKSEYNYLELTHNSRYIDTICLDHFDEPYNELKCFNVTADGDLTFNNLYIASYKPNTLTIPSMLNGMHVNSICINGDGILNNHKYINHIHIRDGINMIGPCSFSHSSISSIRLPYDLQSIGECAFEHCKKLTHIDIPDRVISIGDRAFQMTQIETIKLPQSIKHLGDYCFYNCGQLKKVVYDCNTESIPVGAFDTCHELKHIEICDSVVNILSRSFINCAKLDTVHLPSSVLFIDKLSFGIGVVWACSDNQSLANECKHLHRHFTVKNKGPLKWDPDRSISDQLITC